tara:strand:- start:2167 stop:4845 length:2679 start_codon:yes stop_codon:yes gene_type:complete
MRVLKRSGNYQEVSFDKILTRIKSLSKGDEFSQKLNIDETLIAQKVVQEIYDGVKTSELDELSSQISMSMYSKHPDFKILAGRIAVSNLHKNTLDSFSEKIKLMYKVDEKKPLIAKYLYDLVINNKETIDSYIDYSRDYDYDFFGLKTLEKTYLYRVNKELVERPQDMLMRVSLSIHRNDLFAALQNYQLMSKHFFTHATPTLYNAGSNREQFASCFLLTMNEDSIKGIYKTLSDCAQISKHAGGIGLSVHDIRATDSYIAGTNGYSNGLVPMLRVFNDTARYVDQGGGKRNGSFAIYVEPWHSDIFEFIELRKNHGNEHERARDLFYALWIPDLFMEKVKEDKEWYLFCPNECRGLSDCWGSEFNNLYNKYVTENKFRKKINARELWSAILTSQIEVGTPYLLYKDSCNKKSNHQHLGTIKSSNLCTEIVEYTSPDETAVCNLASISLKKFIINKNTDNLEFIVYSKDKCVYCDLAKGLLRKKNIKFMEIDYLDLPNYQNYKFPQIYLKNKEINESDEHIGGYTDLTNYLRSEYDFDSLLKITKQVTKNLNNIIDYNYYPTIETRNSNLRHRPIGIGVQGLANVFFEMGYPFDSQEAKKLNEEIFETIYYGSMVASMELSRDREEDIMKLKTGLSQNGYGDFVSASELDNIRKRINPISEELNREKYLGSYSSFEGSPLQQGKFQFDLWGYNPVVDESRDCRRVARCDWISLMEDIQKYGVRNSLTLAPMPTASTAQILGNYECFEPIMSNIYSRRVLAGEYMIINDYLVDDLISLDLWSNELKDKIIEHDGSIQGIETIPQIIKDLYKTVWEIKQKNIIDMAADRGKFICQSQSMNLFLESPNPSTLTSMHFYGWKKGLKTGIYYLRSRPSSKAIQFTLSPDSNCDSCGA